MEPQLLVPLLASLYSAKNAMGASKAKVIIVEFINA